MGGGTRHYDFAKELIARGHTVTIVASSFHYARYKEMKSYNGTPYLKETIDGIDFIWFHTPPYYGNSIDRLRNMLSYTFKALRLLPKLLDTTPDIIIGSSVHLFAVYAAYRLSKRYKTPFIMEVRDIWPQTLIDIGMPKWHPLVIAMSLLERFLYKKADKIITSMPYANRHIERFTHAEKKVVWISNGVDLKHIDYTEKEPGKTLTICYTGAIGVANNLYPLIEVAEHLRSKKEIFFRIVGEGAQKARLQQLVLQKRLQNVSIEDAVPKQDVYKILQSSDVLFLCLQDSPLYKYGISLNKLYDYMASGRVVLFCGNAKNNPVKDANAGFTVAPNDIEALKESILRIYRMPQKERNEMGKRGREHVEKYYTIEHLADRLEKVLFDALRDKKEKDA